MKYLILLFVGIFIFLASCNIKTNLSVCCQQCLTSASEDPAAYDLSIKACSQYELSKGCKEYFEQNEINVGECREMEKEAEKLKK